jgi:hypothetical protein
MERRSPVGAARSVRANEKRIHVLRSQNIIPVELSLGDALGF